MFSQITSWKNLILSISIFEPTLRMRVFGYIDRWHDPRHAGCRWPAADVWRRWFQGIYSKRFLVTNFFLFLNLHFGIVGSPCSQWRSWYNTSCLPLRDIFVALFTNLSLFMLYLFLWVLLDIIIFINVVIVKPYCPISQSIRITTRLIFPYTL